MWAAENIPALVTTNSKAAIINDVHGIVRTVNGRSFLVQWFVAGTEARLYEVTHARLYGCQNLEFQPSLPLIIYTVKDLYNLFSGPPFQFSLTNPDPVRCDPEH